MARSRIVGVADPTGDLSGSQYLLSVEDPLTVEELERFESYRDGSAPGCWIWRGSIRYADPKRLLRPYGRFWLRGRLWMAHRLAFEIVNGPVPEGLVVHHVCGETLCVRPSHLKAITHKENLLSSARTLAGINARKTHCPQGHPYEGGSLYISPDGWRSCRACRPAANRRYRSSGGVA